MEEEVLYSPMVKSQSFRGPMPLDCELHRCFSVLFWDRIVEWAGVGVFSSPTWKTRAGWSWVLAFPQVS